MPRNNPWTYKKRRRNKKRKIPVQEAKLTKCSRRAFLVELSKSIRPLSEIPQKNSEENEEIIYKDKFQHSTTPTSMNQAETSSETTKRCTEDEKTTPPKKSKMARKNPRNYTRKRRKKRKCSTQEKEVTACSQLQNPVEPSNSMGLFSKISENNPQKNEGLICKDKDKLLKNSTTPPSIEGQSGTSNEIFMRCSEVKNAATSKKSKVSDVPEIIKPIISIGLICKDSMLQHSTSLSTTESQSETSNEIFKSNIEDKNTKASKKLEISNSPKIIKLTVSNGLICEDTIFQKSTSSLTTENQAETSNETFKPCIEDENATSKKSKVSNSPKIIKCTISNDLIGKDTTFQHSTTPLTIESQLETSANIFERNIEDENATSPKKIKGNDSPKTITRTISSNFICKDTMFQYLIPSLTTSNEILKPLVEDKNATLTKKSKISDSPKIIRRTFPNDLIGGDKTFEHATTPLIIECQLETSSNTFKCKIEDESATTPKKTKVSDSTKTIKQTISDDCFILENPQLQIKDEVKVSRPNVSILCPPLKTNCLEKILPWEPNTLQGNGDLYKNVVSCKKISDVKAKIVGEANKNYYTTRVNTEQSKTRENNNKFTTNNPDIDINKTIYPLEDKPSDLQVNDVKSMPSEIIKDIFYDESCFDHHVGNNISIENAKSNLSKIYNDTNFEDSSIEHSVINKEVQVKLFCDDNKKVVDSSSSNLLIAAEERIEPEKTVLVDNSWIENPQNYEDTSQKSYNERSTDEISSQTLSTDNMNCKSIFVNTDRSTSSKDSQVYESGVFRTQFLKCLNRDTRVDVPEMSHSLPFPENLFKDKQEVYETETDIIPDSQENCELYATEKIGESLDLQINDKQLSNLKVGEILQTISLESNIKKTVEVKPFINNLDSNATSFQLQKSINQKQVQTSLNSVGLGDKMCQDNSPNKLFELPSMMSVSSRQGSDSDSHTIYFNSPMDIESLSEDSCPSTICLSSSDEIKRSETSSNLLMNAKEISNEELFSKDFLRQILNNVKSTEKPNHVADLSSSSNSFIDPAGLSNVIMNESVHENLKGSLKDKQIENMNSTLDANEKNPQFMKKKFSKCLPFPRENISKQMQNSSFYLPAAQGKEFETSKNRIKISEDALLSKRSRVKKNFTFEEYKKRKIRATIHNPNKHFLSEFPSNSSDSSYVSSNSEQNIFIPHGYQQTFYPPIFSATPLQNPGYNQMVNTYYLRDPRLTRNCSVQGVKEFQPRQNLVTHEIPSHSALTHEIYSSRSVNPEFVLNPSLTIINLPPPLPSSPPPPLPPLPPYSPILEEFHSIDYNHAPNSLMHNKKTLEAAKSLTVSSQSSEEFVFESLLPTYLKECVGKNIIQTDNLFLILLERKIDWIQGIEEETGITRISELGGKFQPMRDNYVNHLSYYNTYFLLLLLECFSKISIALKGGKSNKKIDENTCNVEHCERKQSYVSFTCSSFIHVSEVENVPKAGQIICVRFATASADGVKILGYVCSSATRAYSHRHDYGHKILKYLNVDKNRNLIKIKIKFYTVLNIPGISLDLPIYLSKLISIKKVLMLNDALDELQRSPLCGAVLNPLNHNIRWFALPPRYNANAMANVVQEIVQSLNPLSQSLTVVKSSPLTDSLSAIVQVIKEIQKSKLPGKILVCVPNELLNNMGINLIETSNNLIIVKRERESLHEKLLSRVLDVMVSRWPKSGNISDYEIKHRILQDAKILLVVSGTCFYKDVQCMTSDITYGIIHDAHSLTEPESLLPLMYGIRHCLLFGDPNKSCHVSSKFAASMGYKKSLFHRVYNLC